MLHWQYKAATFYLRMTIERVNEQDAFHLTTIKAELRALESRWKVAGTYLCMLDAHELMRP